ncbi:hypothetical protein [Vibrio sonorensis]|uniref:hypothetical protein n=1 Tax=Vibrio sonorensis TaxID=1004316 RepID=UPI0008DA0BC3|nr:hypothetical protein [Vibrio sonorensis]
MTTDKERELQHIWLEIEGERWAMLERFLFSYVCFREDFVTRKGKPDWQEARNKAPRSIKAQGCPKDGLLIEPLIPLESVVGEIKRHYRDEALSYSRLERVLDSLLQYVAITKEEQQKIKILGLENSMPKEWYLGDKSQVTLRFDAAGIQLGSRINKRKIAR